MTSDGQDSQSSKIVTLFNSDVFLNSHIIPHVFNYWDRLRGNRIAPFRSEVDPRAIKQSLEHCFILEKTNNQTLKIRLAGLEMCNVLGMELRGMPAHSIIEPKDRETFNKEVLSVLTTPHIVELNLSAKRANNTKLSARLILLPMLDENSQPTRILGAIVLGQIFQQTPIRFGIDKTVVTRIVFGQDLPKIDSHVQGFAEQNYSFVHAQKRPPKTGRPNLKIV